MALPCPSSITSEVSVAGHMALPTDSVKPMLSFVRTQGMGVTIVNQRLASAVADASIRKKAFAAILCVVIGVFVLYCGANVGWRATPCWLPIAFLFFSPAFLALCGNHRLFQCVRDQYERASS